MTTRSGTIALSAGKHELSVIHWQNGGGNGLDVLMIAPDSNGNLGGDFAQAATDTSFAIPVSQLTASTTNVLSTGFQDIIVSGTNPSTLAVTYAMVANNTNKVTMNPGSTLQIQGAAIRLNNVSFNGAGTYTFAGSTNSANSNDFSLGSVNAQGQTGIVINQNTQGAFGQLVLDTFPAATNAAGAITYQATQGNIVVVGNT